MQLRRQARERRQYVYAKSLEAQERLTYERKRQLKEALASGKPLPTELRKDAQQLSKELAFDEAQAGAFLFHSKLLRSTEWLTDPSTHVDNEYYNAGIMDPKILITTSRDPSSKLLQFSKVWFLERD
jgi:U3 small nucleolar ribonucleoprotein protein IMP4